MRRACGGGESDTVDPGSADPESALTLEEAQAPVEKAPPELAAHPRRRRTRSSTRAPRGSTPGSPSSRAGIPVVVNKWASWCGPCREEFPEFQEQAIERGDEVAFIGLLSNDGPETGETFLSEPSRCRIPSYLDPDQEIADRLGHPARVPDDRSSSTPSGEVVYTKYGPLRRSDRTTLRRRTSRSTLQ